MIIFNSKLLILYKNRKKILVDSKEQETGQYLEYHQPKLLIF